MQSFVRLGERLREQSQNVGLDMARFVIEPSLDGEVHSVHAMFLLDDDFEATAVESEPADSQPELDDLIAAEAAAEDDRRATEARERLKEIDEILRDPKNGLGLDD